MQKILCFLSEYCLRILMVPQGQSGKTTILKLQNKSRRDVENIILPTTKKSLDQTICFLIMPAFEKWRIENITEHNHLWTISGRE